jgi:NAD(P)-dependent dehydrogenase (short-subunit alcohol dehydrogenase family)
LRLFENLSHETTFLENIYSTMPSISGHSILIIGGSSGMGFAAAKLALESGARIAIASSNPTRVTDAVKRLKSSFPDAQISGHECDLTQDNIESRLETVFKEVTTNGNLLDHVIYTAGRAPETKPIQETDIESIIKAAQLGPVATFVVAKVAQRFLKKSYTSSITFTGGRVAEKPMPNYSVYSGFASGLIGMTRNLALDMAPIRVNAVSPGATLTEMWGPHREQIGEAVAKTALLGKAGTAEEVGEAYIYLMKNSDATGSYVCTNGGAVLQ